MLGLITIVQGIGLAYAAGLNLYAAVAVTGLGIRWGWITVSVPIRRVERFVPEAG